MFAMMKKNGRLAEALKQSNSQDAVGGGKERSLYEQGRAAYAERKWDDAARHFQALSKEFPQNAEAPVALRRALSRLTESRTGKYCFERMMAGEEAGSQDVDVADYAGPIEVADVPRKDKGIIATEDIKMGTLIFVEKPFASTELAQKSRLVKPLSHLTPAEVAERMFLFDHGQILGGYVNHSCLRKYRKAIRIFNSLAFTEFRERCVRRRQGGVRRPRHQEGRGGDAPLRRSDEAALRALALVRMRLPLVRAGPRRSAPRGARGAAEGGEGGPAAHSIASQVCRQGRGPLKKMRKTYADRSELQTLLYWPLEALGDHCKAVGNYRKAIKYYEEAIEVLGPLLHEKGNWMMAQIAFCYKDLNDEGMARKYAQMAADQGHCSFPDLLKLL